MSTFLCFGDQTTDWRAVFSELFQGRPKKETSTAKFLEQTILVLREEAYESDATLDFTDLWELAELPVDSRHGQAVESALCCVCQLATYINKVESTPSLSAAASFPPRNSHIVGLCTGLIAASVVASAQSLSDLLELSTEAVRVAYRVGDLVGRVAQDLHSADQSWSTIVVAKEETVRDALQSFHRTQKIPASSHIWVSAVSANTVTVSGPPGTRKRFLSTTSSLQECRQLEVTIAGPYHASHLYTNEDLAAIMEPESIQKTFGHAKVYRSLHSSVTGEVFAASDSLSLLRECLREILIVPLHLERVLQRARVVALATCRVCAIGPTNLSKTLHNYLQTNACEATLETIRPPVLTESSIADIAIVGMSGRFPNAPDHEALWKLLENGLDVHREVPKDRFDVNTHYDASGKAKNTTHTPFGCFIESPGLFDPRFFNMSPREAQQTDPMQRLILVTAYEAMEMAGIVPGRTPATKSDRIGTFYGQTSDDWREINAAQDIDTYFTSGGVRAFGPGRLNYHFKFSGPSYSVDTACSSSLAAIQLACTSLRAGECDTAFTGGANILTNPDIFSGLSRGFFLSKTGPCKTWDNDADGYCRGDGVATVILKRLADAITDHDPVLGVIRGIGTNHSAEAVSITHPHAGAQSSLFAKVLRESNVQPENVSYVEMHGTGTQAGDSTEMKSVTDVLAPEGSRRVSPLYLGAVKSNIGHGEAVAGVSSLIKLLLMLQKSSIPPHCGIKGKINKNFPTDLSQRNVHIPLENMPFKRPEPGSRFAMLNNFSAAGGNSALLLEDAPVQILSKLADHVDAQTHHILTVSAKSLFSFRQNVTRLQSYLKAKPDVDLADLSYTTTARRIHHGYRSAISFRDVREASLALETITSAPVQPVPRTPPPIAMAFTGQGSQYSGIAKDFYRTSKYFRNEINSFLGIAKRLLFPSFLPLIEGEVDVNGLSPVVVQLGMVCIQMALTRLWAHWGVQPSIVVGHSLGEFAALHAAGVISAADTIFLVGQRAMLLERYCSAGTHSMLAVKGGASQIMGVAGLGDVELACSNSASETVLSGTSTQVNQAHDILTRAGYKATRLKVPFAFHSSQVEPILSAFEAAADGVSFQSPKIPFISPLLGRVVDRASVVDSSYLARHARQTVDFLGGLLAAKPMLAPETCWIEIGAHPVCSSMIKSTLDATALPSLRRGEEAWKSTTASICKLYSAGIAFDWTSYHKEYQASLQTISLPAYAFDEKVYWLDYKNDWCLTKGDDYTFSTDPFVQEPSLAGTSIHRILSQRTDSTQIALIAETDFTDSMLCSVVEGHQVNGVGLCPSSLYADMAYTLCTYAYALLDPDTTCSLNVRDMECPTPLILGAPDSDQGTLVTTELNFEVASQEGHLVISTENAGVRKIHATCVITFEDETEWTSEWQRIAFLIRNSVKALKTSSRNGDIDQVGRRVAYRLFANLVQYSDKFQGMEEVSYDPHELEGTSTVKFRTTSDDGNFTMSPYCLDSLAHLAGFLMNATADLREQRVYISHGWKSMRFSQPIDISRSYTVYVKMQPTGAKVYAGDVYVLDDQGEIVGVVGSLKFRELPRAILNTLLPSAQGEHRSESVPRRGRLGEPSLTPGHGTRADSRSLSPAFRTLQQRAHSPQPSLLPGHPPRAGSRSSSAVGRALSAAIRRSPLPAVGRPDIMRTRALSALSTTTYSDSESESVKTTITPPQSSNESPSGNAGIIETLRSTIAREIDVSIEEISSPTDLGSMGIDSLMSLTILGSLREKTGMTLSSTLFQDNQTFADLKKSMGLTPPTPKVVTPHALTHPQASSFLLQGNPKTATQKLFLLPDGSGSATSYCPIPAIHPSDLCVYGLNSPFMTKPDAFTIGVFALCKIYIAEILRRQPQGPYHLGGWSAGGVLAFEAAQQLMAAGAHVETLILIDSPYPVNLAPMPSRVFRFFDDIGLFGDGGGAPTPQWLIPHFEASVRNLRSYTPRPFGRAGGPRTLLIWATDGVCHGRDARWPPPGPPGEDQRSMLWLLDDRKDFGCNGWERLIGEDNYNIVTVEGNHFSMMKGALAAVVGEAIRDVMY